MGESMEIVGVQLAIKNVEHSKGNLNLVPI